MAAFKLVSRAIPPIYDLNWRFLVLILVSAILATTFLLYFNRLIASVLSRGIRIYTWRTFQAYIDIESIQFSLLAGRIFFKGLRYHGQNETIVVADGYITWRYWLRRVKEVDLPKNHGTKQDSDSEAELGSHANGSRSRRRDGLSRGHHQRPCRIDLHLRGLEWFVYNRSPAYETVLEGAFRTVPIPPQNAENSNVRHRAKRADPRNQSTETLGNGFLNKEENVGRKSSASYTGIVKEVSSDGSQAIQSVSTKAQTSHQPSSYATKLPAWLEFLPIEVHCSKAGFVIGSIETESVLTGKCERIVGLITVGSAGLMDLYKQIITLEVKHPIINLKANQSAEDSSMPRKSSQVASKQSLRLPPFLRRTFRKVLPNRLARKFDDEPYKIAFTAKGGDDYIRLQHRWLGLDRYLDREDDRLEQERWKNVEYARSPNILEAPSIAIDVHWDAPGPVSSDIEDARLGPTTSSSDINGGEPPDWGIDIRIRGGNLAYGPWADRQRTGLQAMFFPSLLKDILPHIHLIPGQTRISTQFKMLVEFEDQTTLRIPTRESSKDWQWRGKAMLNASTKTRNGRKDRNRKDSKSLPAGTTPDSRPLGWIDINIAKDSTASLIMDLVANAAGFTNHLAVDLRNPELTTSVNHGLFCKAESQVVSCYLPNPLKWNDLHEWDVSILGKNVEVFLLRDHVYLLNDLVGDWNAETSSDYYTFVPYFYNIKFQIEGLKMFLNVNESNIINNPASLEDNNFIVIKVGNVTVTARIDSTAYRPLKSSVNFEGDIRRGAIDLCTSRRNTYNAFLERPTAAILKQIQLKGVFTFNTSTSPGLTDSLKLDMHGEAPRIVLYGFLIRYIMKIKDNYFGDDIHFRTFDELQEQKNHAASSDVEIPIARQHHRLSNDLDIVLHITTDRASGFVPCAIYSTAETVKLDMSSVAADLRFTAHYMDLSVVASPISLSRSSFEENTPEHDQYSATELFIDGLEVYGHRLFGLPPTEPTYVCNWDFEIGAIVGECSLRFAEDLLKAGRAFAFTFDDTENTLKLDSSPIIHDTTFLRVHLLPSNIWIQVEAQSVLCQVGEINMGFHDWATTETCQTVRLDLTDLRLALINTAHAMKSINSQDVMVKPSAYLQSAASISMRKNSRAGSEVFRLQQQHVREQDKRTNRMPWLCRTSGVQISPFTSWEQTARNCPVVPVPPMPAPVSSICHTISRDFSERTATHGSDRSSLSREGQPHVLRFDPLSTRPSTNPEWVDAGTSHRPRLGSPRVPSRARLRELRQPQESVANKKVNKKPRASGFGFSSPYKRPYFALLSARIDLSNVPSIASISEVSSLEPNVNTDAESITQVPSSEPGTTGIIVECGPQARMLCTKIALDFLTKLMRDRHTPNPVEMVDNLQIDLLTKLQNSIKDFSEPARRIFRVDTRVIAAKLVIDDCSHQGKDNIPVAVQVQSDGLVGTAKTWGSAMTWHVHAEEMTLSTFIPSTNESAENQRTVVMHIASPVLWMSDIHSGSRMSFESSNIDLELDAKWVLCLPSVLEKGKDCIRGLSQSLDRHSHNKRMRLQRLVASLIAHGEGIPDAAFLASGTYITRLTPKHVRTSDSWKMLSRLRQVLRYSTNATQEAIYGEYSETSTFATEELATRVLRSFEQWRAWDLLHVNESLLLKHVFKKPNQDKSGKRTLDFTRGFVIQIDRCRILICLDSVQNELLIERLFVCLEQLSAAEKGTPASAVHPLRRLQVSVHRIFALIRWELVLSIVRLSRSVKIQAATTTQDLVDATYGGKPRIQLLLSLDFIQLILHTMNTQSDLICRKLIASGSQASDASQQLTMAADAVELKVAGGSRKLLMVNSQQPRMASSMEYQTSADSEPSKALISGLCEHIHAQLMEEPLTLMQIARQVINDESKDVEKTMKSTPQPSRGPKPSCPASKKQAVRSVQVVLIVKSYTLLVRILPSLHYKLHGKAAKSKLTIVSYVDLEVEFHYDVFRYVHSFTTSANPESDSISLFAFPPMFGHIRLNKISQNILVLFKGLVEQIHFDAHSVHALLVMFNRPEIASFASRFQDEAQSLTDFLREHPIRDQPGGPRKGSSSTISYDMTLNITGLRIDANVPQSNSSLGKVGLQFGSEGLYFKAKNTDGTAEIDSMPDVRVKAMKSGARLYRFEKNTDCTAGTLRTQAILQITTMRNEAGVTICLFRLQSNAFEVVAQATSAPVLTAILGHLQDTMKEIDFNQEVSTFRKIRHPSRVVRVDVPPPFASEGSAANQTSLRSLLNASYVLEIRNVRAIWEIGDSIPMSPIRQAEDLVFSISRVAFATRGANAARLSLRDVALQVTPWKSSFGSRSANSALLPEVVFNVAYQSDARDRQLAFQAAGKSLDLRLTSRFVLPVSDLRRSIAQSVQQVRQITEHWHKSTVQSGSPRKSILGERRLTSLQIDADFAGAVVHLRGTRQSISPKKADAILRTTRAPHRGHTDQFTSEDTTAETSLRSPGIAFNVHYRDSGEGPKSLSAETRVNASSNTLHPRIIPVIREISSSIKEMTGEQINEAGQDSSKNTLSSSEESIRRSADPSTVFGDCQINLGLRICKQDFGLTCQPYAKVAATAQIDEIYVMVNSVKSQYKDQAYNLSATLKHLTVGVQHAYSRESTVTFDMRSVFLSLMSNQDAEGVEGLSVILRIDPTKATVNARQVQDVLLFQDIWMPPAERGISTQPEEARSPESFPVMIQRYQQVSTATTLPWNVVILMSEVDIQLDLGQSLGKSTVMISHGWMSSRKSSQAEQNLCFGLKSIVIHGLGRMSGLLELRDLRIRTSIRWPHTKIYSQQTPFIQASFNLDEIKIKAGLDYQTFAVAVISGLGLFMYNVRGNQGSSNDHLLAMLDGRSVQVYLTTLSASQALALWQAGERFIAEKQAAYQASLAEVERNLQRRPSLITGQSRRSTSEPMTTKHSPDTSLQLRTEVVVAIGSVNFGAFPSTFSDNQIFKLETLDVAAKFSCMLRDARLLSTLSLQLGRLRISLSPVVRPSGSTAISELSIDDLVSSATKSQGGTILRVPMVVASMQTWQDPGSTHIDYTFRSSFQGKVDVGWSYARVSFIRGMWNSHARALAQRLGKPLPKSAVQISGGPQPEGSEVANAPDASNKITAVISVPVSKYTYTALEPPLIETPQLRDMGEATPPLEWIGLHRERLPNVTHQIIIVSLLEVAKEVEDAYTRILGSSSA